jgi:DNA repair photolyase
MIPGNVVAKHDDKSVTKKPRKGRGAVSNPDGRYETLTRVRDMDGWSIEDDCEKLSTSLTPERSVTIITRNDSPDVLFDQSINPYRGCEHGCVYCYARPTHAYLGLSPGLDFEARLFYKADAALLLQNELMQANYRCSPIVLGANTDAYQPSERTLLITRQILKVLSEFNHPLYIITKSALVERDMAILIDMAKANLVQVLISVTTLDASLSRRMEPRATAPYRRIQAIARLSKAGIPTGVLVAPVIPVLTDAGLEAILAAAQEAGAQSAGYVILRLPHEVKVLFQEWLDHHEPLKVSHIMTILRQWHGGKDYDSKFGQRMRGTGAVAELLAKRFQLACRRLGLNATRRELNCALFTPPPQASQQMALF